MFASTAYQLASLHHKYPSPPKKKKRLTGRINRRRLALKIRIIRNHIAAVAILPRPGPAPAALRQGSQAGQTAADDDQDDEDDDGDAALFSKEGEALREL
jgi:hypothetical protein